MKPEYKEKWLAALRSKEYKQGIQGLRVGDRFCCLGVLCDIVSKEKDIPWEKGTIINNGDIEYRFKEATQILPELVILETGINDHKGIINDVIFKNQNFHTLTRLNDFGADFEFIAEIIEKEY